MEKITMESGDGCEGSKLKPLFLGIISDPPTLVLCYEKAEEGMTLWGDGRGGKKGKMRKRKMPLRDFTDRSNVSRVAFALRQRHQEYLANVLTVTIEKMLRVIQEIQKGVDVEDAVLKVNTEYEVNPEEDLNKLSTDELCRKKAIMDENFRKNLVKPGDPDYVYDKVEEFDKNDAQRQPCEWDEEEGNNSQEKETNEKADVKSNDVQLNAFMVKNCPETNKRNEKIGESSDKEIKIICDQTKDDEIPKKDDKTVLFEDDKNKGFSNIKISETKNEKLSDSDEGLDEELEIDIEGGDIQLDDDDDFWA